MKIIIYTLTLLFVFASPCIAKGSEFILFNRGGDLWKYSFENKKEEIYIKKAKSPACSKDGKKLAFVRDGNIWTADVMGENQKQITAFKEDYDLDSLEWFPSGDKIFFSRSEDYQVSYSGEDRKLNWPPEQIESRSGGLTTRSIWILSLKDSSIIKFIGHTPGSMFDNIKLTEVDSPKWHPEKEMLVFTRGGDIWGAWIGKEGLVELDKEEARIAPVAVLADHYGASPASYVADHLSWSPNGKKILYEIHRHNGSGTGDIYEINADGSLERKVYSAENDCYPVYSPDGRRIAFIKNGGNIYVIGRKKLRPRILIRNVEVNRFIWIRDIS